MNFWTKRKLKAFEGWKRSIEENKVFIINEVDYEKFMEKYVDENEVADVLRKIVDDVVDVVDVVDDDVVVDDVEVDKKMIYLTLKSSLLFLLFCILWFYSYSADESLEVVEKEQQKKGFAFLCHLLRGLCCRINSHLPHCVSTNKI